MTSIESCCWYARRRRAECLLEFVCRLRLHRFFWSTLTINGCFCPLLRLFLCTVRRITINGLTTTSRYGITWNAMTSHGCFLQRIRRRLRGRTARVVICECLLSTVSDVDATMRSALGDAFVWGPQIFCGRPGCVSIHSKSESWTFPHSPRGCAGPRRVVHKGNGAAQSSARAQ